MLQTESIYFCHCSRSFYNRLCRSISCFVLGAEKENKEESATGGQNEAHNAEPDDAEHSIEENYEMDSLRHQLFTLTTSLSTVTEEKSKIVATYQAERKKLKVTQTSMILYVLLN